MILVFALVPQRVREPLLLMLEPLEVAFPTLPDAPVLMLQLPAPFASLLIGLSYPVRIDLPPRGCLA